MTTDISESAYKSEPPKTVLRLRLNLTKPVESNDAIISGEEGEGGVELLKRTPRKKSEELKMNGGERKSSPRKGGLVRSADDNEFKQNVRLKVRLNSHEEEEVENKTAPKKIVLSLKRGGTEQTSNTDKNDKIDIETVEKEVVSTGPKKKGRKRIYATCEPPPKSYYHRKKKELQQAAKRKAAEHNLQSPFATLPPFVRSAPVVSSGSNLALTGLKSSTTARVPIAAFSSFSTMTPIEREEERITRKCLSDTYSDLWGVIKKDLTQVDKFENWQDAEDLLLTYWMTLSPIDYIYQRQSKSVNIHEPFDPKYWLHVETEFAKLGQRFEKTLDHIASKTVSAELLVLEQRLALEEDKFLNAKLRSEYSAKMADIMLKKKTASLPQLSSSTQLNVPSPKTST